MLLTLPLSWPISKLLDCLLGEELGTVYDKKKLIELLKVTKDNTDLQKEEVDIVTGALRYKEKTVRNEFYHFELKKYTLCSLKLKVIHFLTFMLIYIFQCEHCKVQKLYFLFFFCH